MKVVAILQARMGSTRLPGKVLADLEGQPALVRELMRLRRATVDEIVVATSTNAEDDEVADCAARVGVTVVRGDEHDVLSRYLLAARETSAEVIVRVTGDCPLLDASVVDRVLSALDGGADYASNVLQRTFPRGLDAEALTRATLERLETEATSPEAREHVTWGVRQARGDQFVTRSVVDPVDNSDLHWTLDTAEDLDRLRRLHRALGIDDTTPYLDIVAAVRARPELLA